MKWLLNWRMWLGWGIGVNYVDMSEFDEIEREAGDV